MIVKMTRKYTAFTKAFKLETLQSANQANVCIASLARDLGFIGEASPPFLLEWGYY
jgi:transposase-like protein